MIFIHLDQYAIFKFLLNGRQNSFYDTLIAP